MKRITILGATGYVGIEILRLIDAHPETKIQHLVSSSSAGDAIGKHYPHLRHLDLPALEPFDIDELKKDSDLFFAALPHGASQETVAALYETGIPVIDMSGDFRYDDPAVYSAWYGTHKAPALLKESVYGLPELYREQIKTARLVGNPGCYPTASILALAPLMKNKLIDPASIIIDAKSGVSGAGRPPTTSKHFCEVDGNMNAYSIASHRHTSEIEQEAGKLFGEAITLNFTPHLVPYKRGILATCYAKMPQYVDTFDLLRLYSAYYKDEPFISVYDDGSLPHVKHVVGSNRVAIGIACDSRTKRVIVVSCIDNLIKGAAGQALQNMNLVLGFPESAGLSQLPSYL